MPASDKEPEYPTSGLKAYPEADAPRPFYYRDLYKGRSGKSERLVAWSGDRAQISQTLRAIIASYGDVLDIQFRIFYNKTGDDERVRRFSVYEIPTRVFLKHMDAFDDILIGDSATEILIRRCEEEQYFAFDDVGFLFLYASTPETETLLQNEGYKLSSEQIDPFPNGHWNVTLADEETIEEKIIKPLQLTEY
jgi:hypothetical protein